MGVYTGDSSSGTEFLTKLKGFFIFKIFYNTIYKTKFFLLYLRRGTGVSTVLEIKICTLDVEPLHLHEGPRSLVLYPVFVLTRSTQSWGPFLSQYSYRPILYPVDWGSCATCCVGCDSDWNDSTLDDWLEEHRTLPTRVTDPFSVRTHTVESSTYSIHTPGHLEGKSVSPSTYLRSLPTDGLIFILWTLPIL